MPSTWSDEPEAVSPKPPSRSLMMASRLIASPTPASAPDRRCVRRSARERSARLSRRHTSRSSVCRSWSLSGYSASGSSEICHENLRSVRMASIALSSYRRFEWCAIVQIEHHSIFLGAQFRPLRARPDQRSRLGKPPRIIGRRKKVGKGTLPQRLGPQGRSCAVLHTLAPGYGPAS